MSNKQVSRVWFSWLHNCVAHPLSFWTGNAKWVVRFHDWTATKWLGETAEAAQRPSAEWFDQRLHENLLPRKAEAAQAQAQRLAEALRRTCRKMKTFSRTGALDGAVAVWVDEIESVLAAHSAQAQPSRSRLAVDAVMRVIDGQRRLPYCSIDEKQAFRNELEAALAAQENK